MDLEEARQAIASVDAQMAELFVQRMEAARLALAPNLSRNRAAPRYILQEAMA